MAMMPAFATADAGDVKATSTVDVDNLRDGVDRIIRDGIDVIATTGTFGECYNLLWDEFVTLTHATVEAVKRRVPLFIGCTSPNPREVVQKMKVVREVRADGVLLGVPYYEPSTVQNAIRFYHDIADLFPDLGIMIYHNPENHKFTIPVSAFQKIVEKPNIVAMKDSHRDTRAFVQLQKIVRGKISVFVNQAQLYPYARLGAAGCWSIDVWMGPWPVLRLRDCIAGGKDEQALEVVKELLGTGTGGRPDASEGTAGKTGIEHAGYIKPGPNRPPFLHLSEAAVERAGKRAAYWKGLCEKYRPLVEAERVSVSPGRRVVA
jgi:4-(2-carboxyphenyl)-2-oxobut-3-enoate aldolase